MLVRFLEAGSADSEDPQGYWTERYLTSMSVRTPPIVQVDCPLEVGSRRDAVLSSINQSIIKKLQNKQPTTE